MQHWKMWIDHEEFGLPSNLFFDKLTDSNNNLEIYLKDGEGFHVRVTFSESALCYRKLDEGAYLRTICWLYDHPEDNFIGKTKFVLVEDSEFFNWLYEESGKTCGHPGTTLTYVFLTDNEIIEVISDYAPLVEII